MNEGNEQIRRKWEDLVSEYPRSGQSVIAFCAQKGVSERQFSYWRKWFREKGAAQFMEVQIANGSVPRRQTTGANIEVRLRNGRRLVVAPEFDVRHLRALLQVLESES